MTTTGVTADELASTKSSILNSEALEYESPRKKLGFLNKMLKHDLDESFIDAQTDVLNNITLDEINSLAKAKIHPEKMTIVIVGNKYLIKKTLQNLQSNTDGIKYNFKVTEIK
jgi:zinc protease